MNALVKKEIRLLLPPWIAAVTLAIVPQWIVWMAAPSWPGPPDLTLFALFGVGVSLLGLASFGQEFTSGTFSILMAQPVSRVRIWRTKIFLLAAALASVTLVFLMAFRAEPAALGSGNEGLWKYSGIISATVAVSTAAGGLWTTLLLRQFTAAFWLTLLAPVVLTAFTAVALVGNPSPNGVIIGLCITLGTYSVGEFLFARWLFFHAQDVGWSGGMISLPDWKRPSTYFATTSRLRKRKPMAALLKKEFQLQQAVLVGAGVLLGLHVIAIVLRLFSGVFHGSLLIVVVSGFVWFFWLAMPSIIGCVAVAEERRLGVLEGQLCLPISRRSQFALKFGLALFLGILFGGLMPLLLEHIAGWLGVPGPMFEKGIHTNNDLGPSLVWSQIFPGLVWFQIFIVLWAAELSFVCFFASTLAKTFLQALSVAIVTLIACVLFYLFLSFINFQRITFFGVTPWHSILPYLVAILVIPITLLWLARLNFNHYSESRRLWRRNLLGIAGAMVFIVVSSAAIYNRAWEVLEPAEPPHGPAKFSLLVPPKLNTDIMGNLLVQLPGGRVWFDSLGYPGFENEPPWHGTPWWQKVWWYLIQPSPGSAGPQQFIAGSNWVSLTARRVDWWAPNGTTNIHIVGYLDTVGIKSDGTLWISAQSKPVVWTGARMIRFGNETNWQQVVRASGRLLLLKTDGTLWQWDWGTNYDNWSQWRTNWPSLRAFNPHQIGTNSDWKEIFGNSAWNFVRKADGGVWAFFGHYKSGKEELELERETNLDQIVTQTFSKGDAGMGYIRKDGTLWVNTGDWEKSDFRQIGRETNWVSVAVNRRWIVALKSDGSLWKWTGLRERTTAEIAHTPPTRLGIHNDWVAIGNTWGGVVSLAADGSLWLWRGPNWNERALTAAPRQPVFLGNVFGKPD